MKIARVFPRRTKASPTDSLAFFDEPGLFTEEFDEVHVSVTFTYDLTQAVYLAKSWERVGVPVKIGGPATGEKGEAFTPGMYLKNGYVITSRGCPNRCWFCSVWKREGQEIRELPITYGWNLLDDNILATSEDHFNRVCAMLMDARLNGHRVEFTGGLEAARLTPTHVDRLCEVKPSQMFFAYDTPDDLEPLIVAGKLLQEVGFNRQQLRCYVLIGHPKDTLVEAEKRLHQTLGAGFYPMGMLWKDKCGTTAPEWRSFQRAWARPALISHIASKLDPS